MEANIKIDRHTALRYLFNFSIPNLLETTFLNQFELIYLVNSWNIRELLGLTPIIEYVNCFIIIDIGKEMNGELTVMQRYHINLNHIAHINLLSEIPQSNSKKIESSCWSF